MRHSGWSPTATGTAASTPSAPRRGRSSETAAGGEKRQESVSDLARDRGLGHTNLARGRRKLSESARRQVSRRRAFEDQALVATTRARRRAGRAGGRAGRGAVPPVRRLSVQLPPARIEETIVGVGALRRALRHGVGDADVKPRGRSRDGRKRREREAWVQCETCSKWRRVRQSVAEAFARADAGQWTCSISEHPRVNACDVPQELPDDDIDERVALGDKCPFYDDDDLDPPEVIREEEEEEDPEDDSDDSDDSADDDSGRSLEDAPPGGWTDRRRARAARRDTVDRGGSPCRDAARRRRP